VSSARQFWVVVHRWAGLTIAFFLIVAGSTGALLTFNQELLDVTQPWRLVSPPSPGAKTLDPITLNAIAQRAAPAGYRSESLPLEIRPGRALMVGLGPPEGATGNWIEVAVDPYRGKVAHISWSDSIFDSWRNIMPFVYRLHYKLAIQDYGIWAFGIAAVIWTLDCFVGFYLTLPIARQNWWRLWGKSWQLRWRRGGYRLKFDLHRAGGLWVWPVLLVFAWSCVGMNMRDVYDPVMRTFGAESMYQPVPHRPVPPGFKPDWPDAYAKARSLARTQGLHVVHEAKLYFDYEGSGIYAYFFATDRDFTDEDGWSSIHFFPNGRLARTIIADGGLDDGGADQWFIALHRGKVWGLPYRISEALLGLTITMLSVTGVIIWMRKRSARLFRSTKTRVLYQVP
jgi:uncharacterized iron-regulated membrane protein